MQIRNALTSHFSDCGEIVKVRIPTDKESGEIKGSCSPSTHVLLFSRLEKNVSIRQNEFKENLSFSFFGCFVRVEVVNSKWFVMLANWCGDGIRSECLSEPFLAKPDCLVSADLLMWNSGKRRALIRLCLKTAPPVMGGV